MGKGSKSLALEIDAMLIDTASASCFKRLPGEDGWLCVRVKDHYALFRFTTDAEIAKGRLPGLRMVARVVPWSELVAGGTPPDEELVRRLLSSRGAQLWKGLGEG